MRPITIADRTMAGAYDTPDNSLSFREKLEIARQLDRMKADIIEFPAIVNPKTDPLLVRTVAQTATYAVLSQPVGNSEASVDAAWAAVGNAAHARLSVAVPTSAAVMEYVYHKKPKAVLELVPVLVAKAKTYTDDVEFCAVDATRADFPFLTGVIAAAIEAGATTVTLCDTASLLLPTEVTDFVGKIRKAVPAMANVRLGISCADGMGMAASVCAAALCAGADEIKCVSVPSSDLPNVETIAAFFKNRGEELGVSTGLFLAGLSRITGQIARILGHEKQTEKEEDTPNPAFIARQEIAWDKNATENDIRTAVRRLGYELTDEDITKVYEAFRNIAAKKPVSVRELEVIVATTALQVPPTYLLDTFLITNSNTMPTTAQINLKKDGETLSGVCIGDGPVDAGFRAIEQIIGHHYELDEFRIQAVTEGREAMGSALVRLRSEGKLYSGNGVSTDIIGASLRAYLNALNKIVYENAEQ